MPPSAWAVDWDIIYCHDASWKDDAEWTLTGKSGKRLWFEYALCPGEEVGVLLCIGGFRACHRTAFRRRFRHCRAVIPHLIPIAIITVTGIRVMKASSIKFRPLAVITTCFRCSTELDSSLRLQFGNSTCCRGATFANGSNNGRHFDA